MKFLFKILLSVFVLTIVIKAQETTEHRWKPLVVNEKKKVWYDTSTLKDMKDKKFKLWVLEMHQPPLQFDQIDGDIYRAKTLYLLNLNNVKYGISKVVYYDVENNELFKHDYGIERYSEDLRYTYPILEKSTIHQVLQSIYESSQTKINE